jgi:hypothetical protein
MSKLSEQLGMAMAGPMVAPGMPAPVIDPAMQPSGFLVKVVKLRNESYPGRGAQGVLPIFVVGHEAMNEMEWSDWVRMHGLPSYGAGYTERIIRDGIDLKEMLPTAGFGRQMRAGRRQRGDHLAQVGALISAVEQWPDLYNQIAAEMGEQEMTLGAFIDMARTLPMQWDVGIGKNAATLGDLLNPSLTLADGPNF